MACIDEATAFELQGSTRPSGRPQVDAEEARNRAYSYSKAPRGKQGFSRDFRLAWQQKKLTGRVVATGVVLIGLCLILWGLTFQLNVYYKSIPSKFKTSKEKLADYQKQVDRLIELAEASRQSALAELQPAFKEWQELKVVAAEARERVRESKADLNSVKELHSQRMNILPAATGQKDAEVQIGEHTESADNLKQAWQQELEHAKDTLTQVSERDKDVVYRESRARHRVESLRQDVQALGAALAEFVEQKNSKEPKELRGTKQPGNLFDRKLLLDVFSRNLEGLKNKRSLRDQQLEEQAAAVLRTLENPIVFGSPKSEPANLSSSTKKSGASDDAEKQGVVHSITGESIVNDFDLGANSLSRDQEIREMQKIELPGQGEGNLRLRGGIASQKSAPPPPAVAKTVDITQTTTIVHPEDESGAAKVQQIGSLVKSGASRAMLPDAVEAEEEEEALPAWLSQRWSTRGSGITGPNDIDTSLRCERSGICEGLSACKQGLGDNLGCITQAAKRQEAVQEAAKWAWDAYRKFAFGKDELLPLSQTSSTWFDLGLTLLDSLDTLLLLGLDSEYEEARRWIANDLKVDPDNSVNLFETTIRALGGLLAAFHLSNGDKVMLYKAASLSLRLLPAFSTQTGIPYSDINLHTHSAEQPKWTAFSSLSEATSLSLEFSYMSRITGDQEPGDAALRTVRKVLQTLGRRDGLAPIYIDIARGALHGHLITLGARGDSYYEYLLKQWLLTGKQDEVLLRGYEEAMRGVRKHMLMRTDHDGLLFPGELGNNGKIPKMDHLVCFLPGLLALGHHNGINTANEGEPNDLEVAEDIMRTCYEMYRRTPTGLAPEIAFFTTAEAKSQVPVVDDLQPGGGDFVIKQHDSHNLLRPETMESLFVLWRVTRRPHFREWAWTIFRAFQMHARVESGGYANLETCLEVPPPKRDKMESFWLAETLKYLYLTLDDSEPPLLSLDEYVFNTEAHPLPIHGSLADVSAGHAYETAPYLAIANLTLDTRIQYWEDMATQEAASMQAVR